MKKNTMEIRINKVALKVFAEYGYKKTTMADIAQQLNVTPGNLYRYFSSKRELYEKTMAYYLLEWQSHAIDTIPRDKDIRIQFKAMCFEAVEYLTINDSFRKMLIRDPDIFPLFPDDDPYEEINNNSIRLIKSILKQGIQEKKFRKVNVELTTQLLWLTYKMFIIRIYIKETDKSMKIMWKEYVDLITNGLFCNTAEPD